MSLFPLEKTYHAKMILAEKILALPCLFVKQIFT